MTDTHERKSSKILDAVAEAMEHASGNLPDASEHRIEVRPAEKRNPDLLRMAFVFRADLPEMTRAKGEIQLGHGVGFLVEKLIDETLSVEQAEERLRLLRNYLRSGQMKVNMEVDDLATLHRIAAKAQKRGVIHSLVTDSGFTIFDGPTVTCIALGPMNSTDCNALTRDARRRD